MIAEHSLQDWEEDCLKWHGKVLENTQYAHWCTDWDDLPINEYCPEIIGCTCDWED